ncbi:hypothetical protein CBS9595_000367 [Malassezia furfur]|nr:hypothetical protein CBS9595_000367 [Malassezia furfur]
MADAAHGARRAAHLPGAAGAAHEPARGTLSTSVDSGYAWEDTGAAPHGPEAPRGPDEAAALADGGPLGSGTDAPPASRAGLGDAPAAAADAPLPMAPRRPPHFAAMHRLRSPWSASNSLARLALHRSQSGYATSSLSAPPSALEAVVDTPPASTAPSVHTASDTRDDAPEPIARPFLHLALLRKITEACVDAASTVPAGAHAALGTPCLLQVGGGLIAVGTTMGATLVFDLSQRLRCVCRARAIGTSPRLTQNPPTRP